MERRASSQRPPSGPRAALLPREGGGTSRPFFSATPSGPRAALLPREGGGTSRPFFSATPPPGRGRPSSPARGEGPLDPSSQRPPLRAAGGPPPPRGGRDLSA